jgi:hypothetical protein
MAEGIYRVKNPVPMEDDVWVVGSGANMFLPKSTYKKNKYRPPFEELPWSDAYFAAKKKEDGNANGS